MSLVKQIFHYLRVYRKYLGVRLYLVFGLMGLASIAEAIGITMLLPLIAAADVSGLRDGLKTSRVNDGLQGMLDTIGIGDSMLGILLFIAFIFVLKGLIVFLAHAYQAHLQAQLMREMKALVFGKYRTMDYGYYCQHNTGHFVNIINGQINGFVESFSSFKTFLTALTTTVIFFATSFLIAWEFALMAVAAGLVLLLLFRRLSKYVHKLSRKAAKEKGHLNKLLVQAMQSFKYLTSTAEMEHLDSSVMRSVGKLSRYMKRKGVANALTDALGEPLAVCLMLSVVMVQVVVLEVSLVSVVVALILFYRAILGIMRMQSKWQKTLAKMGSFDMVEKEIARLNVNQEPSGKVQIGDFSEKLELRDISFAYGKSKETVLLNLSMAIKANTTVAFVGESGAGKSTLADILTLILRPQTGEILIDGVPGPDIDLSSWRRQIGYVSQETVVFDDTIANNIALWKNDYAKDSEARSRIEKAARQAHADDFIRDLPDGYNTVVGDRGIRLSGGQRQRLFLARELYKQPRLLILDEATSALDSESEKYIQESIDALKRRMTVVLIAHRLSTIQNADKIYVLDKGQVVEEGTYKELAGIKNGFFLKMVSVQAL
jgi:subfamily B ATP-binding cassette protein MsbA